MRDTLAAGVLLRHGDIWMRGIWDRGAWSRLAEGASWPVGNWHPTQWADLYLKALMMLMAGLALIADSKRALIEVCDITRRDG